MRALLAVVFFQYHSITRCTRDVRSNSDVMSQQHLWQALRCLILLLPSQNLAPAPV
jgi:hypothetical protein